MDVFVKLQLTQGRSWLVLKLFRHQRLSEPWYSAC